MLVLKAFTKNECLGLSAEDVLGHGFQEGLAWNGNDPPLFSGRPLECSEWHLATEKAFAVVPPRDQVRFDVSNPQGDS